MNFITIPATTKKAPRARIKGKDGEDYAAKQGKASDFRSD